jgi:hypothetical protein
MNSIGDSWKRNELSMMNTYMLLLLVILKHVTGS